LLWSDRDADEEEGRKAAERRLQQFTEQTDTRRMVNGFTADELARVREELAHDPDFLDAIARSVLKQRYG
jgi:hypothetical protein